MVKHQQLLINNLTKIQRIHLFTQVLKILIKVQVRISIRIVFN